MQKVSELSICKFVSFSTILSLQGSGYRVKSASDIRKYLKYGYQTVIDCSYPHNVETGGSTSGWSRAGMSELGVQSKHNQGSTEKLLIGQRCSQC